MCVYRKIQDATALFGFYACRCFPQLSQLDSRSSIEICNFSASFSSSSAPSNIRLRRTEEPEGVWPHVGEES